VKLPFDEHGIEIPFMHRTLYFGEASLPFKFSQTAVKSKETKS